MPLNKDFYNQDTVTIAKRLLGKKLVHFSKEGITSGMIVETESYLGSLDPAAHSYRGKTKRTEAMFDEPGHAYIYFTYGMYFCFNVTTAPKGIGEAVLIRALEPLEGTKLMEKRRKIDVKKNLCSGPAKLVIAMGITKDQYGVDLTSSELQIHEYKDFEDYEISVAKRIGISVATDMPLRFYLTNNEFVSH